MITLAIQAGGESSRMGKDKALLPFLGHPLILRVVDRLAAFADEVVVTANNPADYAFLGLLLFADLLPGRGALGGLYTAINVAKNPLVAVAACDMPFASRALFEYERDLLIETGADVVIPSSAEGLEPLHAVYRRATCLPAIQDALAAGEWKLIAWFPAVKVRMLTPAETARHDPQGLAFLNLNTPEEFRRAERLATESAT
ncbi:MAG: molybdenum cofactor guanylyltransferase [Anaerolineales bacterium]|nr:molybdenum cofactor guanylyltransferase [Anaerolineales bacterium]